MKTDVEITKEGKRPLLLPDHLRQVAHYLPAYRFRGKKSINFTHRALNTATFKASTKAKTTHQALIDSCKTPEDAINILTDETLLCQELRFSEVLRIAGFHSLLVQKLLDPKESYLMLKKGEIAFLGSGNVETARQILARRDLSAEFDADQLELLAEHEEIAQQIISTPSLLNNLGSEGFLRICKKHVNVAKFVFSHQHLLNFLLNDADSDDFTEIIQTHKGALSQTIYENKTVLARLTILQFSLLGKYDIEVAKQIICDLEKFALLKGPELAELAQNHSGIAMGFLDNPEIRKRLKKKHARPHPLTILGRIHIEIAEKILNDQLLCANNKFTPNDRVELIMHQPRLARVMLADLLYRSTITPNQLALGGEHVEIGRLIVNDNKLLDKVLDSDDASFLYLVIPDEEITLKLMKHPRAFYSLPAEDLATLGKLSIKVAEMILKDFNLFERLFYTGLVGSKIVKLCLSHPSLAKKILSQPKLYNMLTEDNLRALCQISAEIANIIYTTPELISKFNQRRMHCGNFTYNIGKQFNSNPALSQLLTMGARDELNRLMHIVRELQKWADQLKINDAALAIYQVALKADLAQEQRNQALKNAFGVAMKGMEPQRTKLMEQIAHSYITEGESLSESESYVPKEWFAAINEHTAMEMCFIYFDALKKNRALEKELKTLQSTISAAAPAAPPQKHPIDSVDINPRGSKIRRIVKPRRQP